MNASRPRSLVARTLVLVPVAVLGLAACTSTPSAKRVALDVIETLPVSEAVKDCMEEKVDGYSEDELQQWADGADAGDQADVTALSQFEADLAACNEA